MVGDRQYAGHRGAQKGTTGNWGIAGNPSSKCVCCASSNANDKTIVDGCCTESKSGFIFTGWNARNSRIGLPHLTEAYQIVSLALRSLS